VIVCAKYDNPASRQRFTNVWLMRTKLRKKLGEFISARKVRPARDKKRRADIVVRKTSTHPIEVHSPRRPGGEARRALPS
jgi:hypothetical protein